MFQFLQGITVKGNAIEIPDKPKIVRVFPILYLTGDSELDEKFYKQKCMLYVPFRGNIKSVLKRSSYTNWKNLYLAYFKQDKTYSTFNEITRNEDDDEFLPNPADFIQRNIFEEISSIGITGESTNLGLRLIDINHNWNLNNELFPPKSVAILFHQDLKIFSCTRPTNNNTVNFVGEQIQVLNLLDEQIQKLQSCDGHLNKILDVHRTVFLQEVAGAGKSTIIEEIRKRVVNAFSEEAIMMVAPTGVAAHHINP